MAITLHESFFSVFMPPINLWNRPHAIKIARIKWEDELNLAQNSKATKPIEFAESLGTIENYWYKKGYQAAVADMQNSINAVKREPVKG